jgi:hypothetical protein
MTGSKKKTFADDTADFAADVQEFVEYVGDELEELRDKHTKLAAEAKPEADEGDVWSSLQRATGTFPDVDRALAMLAATVRDLADVTSATLAGRENEPDAEAEKPAAKKTADTDKSGDAKKSS